MDRTEPIRQAMVEEINSVPSEREVLEASVGQVWDTKELQEDFEVKGFLAPFIAVRRKSDGLDGTMLFQHMPRFYWGFTKS